MSVVSEPGLTDRVLAGTTTKRDVARLVESIETLAAEKDELLAALRVISSLRIDTRKELSRGVNEARIEMQRLARAALAKVESGA